MIEIIILILNILILLCLIFLLIKIKREKYSSILDMFTKGGCDYRTGIRKLCNAEIPPKCYDTTWSCGDEEILGCSS